MPQGIWHTDTRTASASRIVLTYRALDEFKEEAVGPLVSGGGSPPLKASSVNKDMKFLFLGDNGGFFVGFFFLTVI